MRERWFGATGRRVPEIAVEGEDGIPSTTRWSSRGSVDVAASSEAHQRGPGGRPRGRRRGGPRALERPEVACVLVPPEQRELLELDLRRLKYG